MTCSQGARAGKSMEKFAQHGQKGSEKRKMTSFKPGGGGLQRAGGRVNSLYADSRVFGTMVAMLLNDDARVETESSSEINLPPERTSYDGSSSLKLYLCEIGKVKLLTPEEEIELANRIRNGDKQAREQMIKSNLRLVVKIARDYENIGLPLLDLISECNIGDPKSVV